MAVAASIVVNDRATTPVAHTFVPRLPGLGSHTFVEGNSVPLGSSTMSYKWREANGQFYIRFASFIPIMVMETINGVSVPRVIRNSFVETNARFSNLSLEQERKDHMGIHTNALAAGQAMANAAFISLEGIR